VIEIEAKVYSPIATALKEEYSGIFVTSEPTPIPEKPLVVGIVQMDNYMSINRLDNSGRERFSTLMFQVDVYSNKQTGKKSQCKEVIDFVDKMMFDLNFTRLSLTPIPSPETGYYRYTARYRAETDGETFYRL
jgi:hypothetical protein